MRCVEVIFNVFSFFFCYVIMEKGYHSCFITTQKIGFTPGEADTTIFFQTANDGLLDIAGWYVDNGLLAAHTAQAMEKMIHDIRGSFEIQDLGEPSRLLGVQVIRDQLHSMIHISQPSFISTLSN